MVTILINTAFRGTALITGEVLIRGRRLFEGGTYFNVYTKVWGAYLVVGGAYLRPGVYQRKYGKGDYVSDKPDCEIDEKIYRAHTKILNYIRKDF